MTELERDLEHQMVDIYRQCTEFKYFPIRFLAMVAKDGPVLTAVKLIMRDDGTSGFSRLLEEKKLELSVEWLICENPKYHVLFEDPELVVGTARKRLDIALKALKKA